MFLPVSRNQSRHEGARYALYVLTFINLLNYADRYVISAVKELIKSELNLTDAETAIPATAMIFVFIIFAIIFGWISDKQLVDRRMILAGALVFWSAATALSGLARNLGELVLFRSLVGVGEAAYSTIAPPLIADFFPMHERNIAYGIFYCAIPVGGALGYAIGAICGEYFGGWRTAFYVCGIPGIILSLFIYGIENPAQGSNDTPALSEANQQEKVTGEDTNPMHDGGISTDGMDVALTAVTKYTNRQMIMTMLSEFNIILTNPHFMLLLAGQTAGNFALGGLADWMSSFLIRFDGSTIGGAGLVLGGATVVGGVMGNILGAKVAEKYQMKIKSAFFLIPALFTIPAAIFACVIINVGNQQKLVYFLVFIVEILIWAYVAPISTATINVIPPHLRARSSGVVIFVQHILGDILSPVLIGGISDTTGSLRNGMQLTWIALIFNAIFWLSGYYLLSPLPVAQDPPTSKITYWEIIFGNACLRMQLSSYIFRNKRRLDTIDDFNKFEDVNNNL